MEVRVVRRGGLAGVRLSGTVHTTDLPLSARADADEALESLPFGREPSAPSRPDGFQYEITLSGGETPRSVVLDESELTEKLRPLIEAAMARGQLG